MADPKFANLPGIAYDQPDVYETADVCDPETSEYYEEEPDNEAIERLHISTKDSYNRFRGKYLTGRVDFSDRLGSKIRTGYDARSGEWEIVGEGEKESPLQKCRRLQCEMNELIDELATIRDDAAIAKEEKESYEAVATIVSSSKKVLDSLRLEQVLGKEVVSTEADAEVKQLISQIEQFKKSGGAPQIQIVQPQSGKLAESTRIAELEHKLHRIEKAIGAKPEKLCRLAAAVGSSSLLEAVQLLSTKAALLQPGQLDLIEARLANLITKMDTIAEKSAAAASGDPVTAAQDANRDQKILELYDIAKRTEPITKILPDMLERMQTLESLHKYASNFSKLIAELENTQHDSVKNLALNEKMVIGITESFETNLENISKKMEKLDARIKAITEAKK